VAEMINSMFTTYARYTCSGAMMMIFFAALIYISAREERKSVRTILVGGSIVMLLFIFCPTLYLFLINVGADQAYRRLWWMLPIGVGLGYSATRLVWKHRINGLLMTAAVLLFCGRMVYGTPDVENRIPGEAAAAASFIRNAGGEGEIKAAFTDELLPYVRMNDVEIILPYAYSEREGNSFRDLMNSERTNFKMLASYCRIYDVRFLVIPTGRPGNDEYERYGFSPTGSSGMYAVFEYTGK